jgi:N-acetylglucosamine-6-phosphate deacetylase
VYTVVPGFIDLQVNGYRGIDFSDTSLTLESAANAIRGLLSDGGCAAVLPTVISSSLSVYEHVLPLLAFLIDGSEEFQGRILGIHLEGPFISGKSGAVGCHNPKNVRAPSVELMQHWQRLAKGHVCLVTVAAEACVDGGGGGATKFIPWCVENGIAVSLGHQLASMEEIDLAAGMGATGMTHLGNGLPNMVHRHKNPIWKGLSDDRLTVMMITDGNHLPKELIRVMTRAKGWARVVVTSDCAPVAGLPNGEYDCFGTRVVVEGNNVRSADLPCLAGSGALMIHCMNHFLRVHGPDTDGLAEGIRMVGWKNALSLIGLSPDAWGDRGGSVGRLARNPLGEFVYVEALL